MKICYIEGKKASKRRERALIRFIIQSRVHTGCEAICFYLSETLLIDIHERNKETIFVNSG